MESKIKQIIEKIDSLNEALKSEYTRLSGKYGFSIRKSAIVFFEKTRNKNKKFKIPTWKYIIPRHIRHFASIPFIYMMIFPVALLDLFITFYNLTAFTLYQIPQVKRKDHFIYDRKFLDYLNIIQKFNCLYCSYVNGLLSYATEIGARTERYWCPVKAANKPKNYHNWYKDFADYGNPQEWTEKFNDHNSFKGK
ncbi:hypothetical protein GW933_01870 [Candidatus Falkowbacteria bacterium]|uniref:Uncharacterized protein n=1 Tax=Candidatus Buchananbacteria bacterium CG10_big_fil_rev_8_21_14_0_10_33_19 TaxID=1974525 RepID=A0A2H0W3S1_9BACT|nr:hypothetical protein [Candidatus Falkowbacteria bacterium]PIS05996.1 MAG: hypothetical protein COT80_04485 [Candidatus Buchananbacteria bacterium CG10_big_fil_rev_8_21_14_0_10_33_19]